MDATRALKNIYENLWRETEKEVDRLQKQVTVRDNIIGTVITNLKNGANRHDVLAWWDDAGNRWLKEERERSGCLLCAHGNDLSPGEYCRNCGLENTWDAYGA